MKVSPTLVKGRSELGRQLTMERFYKRESRSVLIAYFWLFILGGLAAHRFYLRKWKTGVFLLLLIWVPSIVLMILTAYADPSFDPHGEPFNSALDIFSYVPFVLMLILVMELISIPFLTQSSNKHLREKLLKGFEL